MQEWGRSLLAGTDWVLVVLVGAGLAVAAAVVIVASRVRRDRLRGDVRRVVDGAVSRLVHELGPRRESAEAAAERSQTLAEVARGLPLVITDVDGDIREVSPAAETLFGWDAEELIARPAAMLFTEASYKDLLPQLARRTLRGGGLTARATLRRSDGSELAAELLLRLLEARSGEARGFALVVRDVTAQVSLERELRASEQRHRRMIEELAEGVLIVQQGRIVLANGAAAALLGAPPEKLIGASFAERIATGDLLLVRERLAAIESGARAEEDEGWRVELCGPGGTRGSRIRLRARRVDHDGGPAVLLLARDPAAEVRARSELAHNEARLDAVLEAVTDAILLLAGGPRTALVRVANRAFAELAGLPLSEILGASEETLWRRVRERRPELEPLAALVTDARSATASRRHTLLLGAGGGRELAVSLAPLASREGEPLGLLVAVRELTEQRRAEHALGEHARELEQSKLELQQAYEQLRAAHAQLSLHGQELERLNLELRRLDDMKTKLLGNVSHELQTPLVSIRGYTEMMLKERLGPINEEQRRGLGLALQNIDRLISMIDNLLELGRADAQAMRLTLSRFTLGPLVQEAIDLLRAGIEDKGLVVSTEIGQELQLEADRDKVQQVFLNLLSNAIKYSRRGGQIRVTARRGQPGYASVRVSDSGVGIPRDALGRIFERHYRVPEGEAARSEGAGLGLSIVRDILRMHGCTIHAESELGQGASFVFTLPLVPNDRPSVREAAPGIGQGAGPVRGEAPGPAKRDAPERPRLRVIRRGSAG